MTEEKQKDLEFPKPDLGFLVEVYEPYEYSPAPPYDNEKETGWQKIGNYFVIDKTKENVEARIREHLPDPSPNKYIINIGEVEKEIEGIYSLGKIYEPKCL